MTHHGSTSAARHHTIVLGTIAATASLISLGDWTDGAKTPFVFWHVVVVHGLMTLPLAWILTGALMRFLPDSARLRVVAAGTALGLLTFALSAASGPIGQWLAGLLWEPAGSPRGTVELDHLTWRFLFYSTWRTLWCLALEFPWCLAAAAWNPQPIGFGRRSAATFLALLAAIAIPWAYVSRETARQTSALLAALDQEDYLSASKQLPNLIALGSDIPILRETPVATLRRLEAELKAMKQRVADPLQSDATLEQVLERGSLLARLDRRADARALLEKPAKSEPAAALMLAALWQQDEAYDESDRAYRHAEQLLRSSTDSLAQVSRIRVVKGLAYNARARHEPRLAEAIYRQALTDLPGAAADLHFQLGQHYRLGGRPTDAIAELQLAARLAPKELARPAAAMMREIQLDTPACVLTPPVVLEQVR